MYILFAFWCHLAFISMRMETKWASFIKYCAENILKLKICLKYVLKYDLVKASFTNMSVGMAYLERTHTLRSNPSVRTLYKWGPVSFLVITAIWTVALHNITLVSLSADFYVSSLSHPHSAEQQEQLLSTREYWDKKVKQLKHQVQNAEYEAACNSP